MAKFVVTRKRTAAGPEADDWEVRLTQVQDLEILDYLPGNKIMVEHPDYVQLHVSISDLCDIGRL